MKALYQNPTPPDGNRVLMLPREKSFLAHMLLSDRNEVMVVEDSLEDSRYISVSPLVSRSARNSYASS